MSISADLVVRIVPQTVGTTGTALRANGLIITQSNLYPQGSLTQWINADDVSDAFGPTSIEYQMAAVYFRGYTNSAGKPKILYIASYVSDDTPLPAWVNGGIVTAPLNTLLLPDGTLNLTIGAASAALTIDLSSATSYSMIAQLIQTAINAEEAPEFATATVTYEPRTKSYRITAGTTGADSTIIYPTGTIADALRLGVNEGAMLSQGSDTKTFTENMQAFLNINRNWVCLTTTWEPDLEHKLEISAWVNNQGVRFCYMAWDTDENAKTPGDETTFGVQVQQLEYIGTAPIYNNALIAAFAMGIAATMDPLRAQGRTTFFGRNQSGLATSVENDADAVALAGDGDNFGNGYNFYGDYATANDNFRWFSRGTVSGIYIWLDTYICAILLKSDLQLAFMNMFNTQPLLPFNDIGYGTIRNYANPVIERYLAFGAIQPGIPLEEDQKSVIINGAGGFDFIGELEREGWYLYLPPASGAERVSRQYVNGKFYYTDGGSIQQIDLTSTTIL